jgi:hypothetical protein
VVKTSNLLSGGTAPFGTTPLHLEEIKAEYRPFSIAELSVRN